MGKGERKKERKKEVSREQRCIFCGGSEDLMMQELMPDGRPAADAPVMCCICSTSLGDRQPADWFRWLRRNDPHHWQMLVENHRLGRCEIAHGIRRVRIGE